jgi:hypothetical protein
MLPVLRPKRRLLKARSPLSRTRLRLPSADHRNAESGTLGP